MGPLRRLVPAAGPAALSLCLAAALALAACGDNHPVPGARVRVVGNATCPVPSPSPSGSPSGPPSATPSAAPGAVATPTPSPSPRYTMTPDVNSSPPVGQPVDEMSRLHVQPGATVTYEHQPPASGCHYPSPLTPGAYDQPVAAEYWVHNLEHGYIVVLYNCPSGCPDDFKKLRDWMGGLSPDPGGAVSYAKVVIVPWKDMKPRFAAVSWDWYDPMDKLDIDEIQRFYDNHNNHSLEGPTAP